MGVSNMSEHPLDTKYRELKADLRPVSDTEPVFNIIDQYIRSTMGNRKVTLDTVWTVARHSEGHSFSSFSHLDNHRLLWHGTNIAVVAAILMTGLRIMPTVNGGRVGRGIYLADELGKSSSYVRTTKLSDGSQLGVLFLVEAALGKMYEITMDDGSLVKAPNGFDSVLAKGKQQPNTANDVTLVVDGCPVKVSQGPVQVNKSLSSSFAQNEVWYGYCLVCYSDYNRHCFS
jgi:poly [ADP-ribose] polymerase